jgi:hypothetical protein
MIMLLIGLGGGSRRLRLYAVGHEARRPDGRESERQPLEVRVDGGVDRAHEPDRRRACSRGSGESHRLRARKEVPARVIARTPVANANPPSTANTRSSQAGNKGTELRRLLGRERNGHLIRLSSSTCADRWEGKTLPCVDAAHAMRFAGAVRRISRCIWEDGSRRTDPCPPGCAPTRLAISRL